MSFQPIDPMNSTGMMLNLISKKQKAIGENLANMDTPGYVRKDVDFSKCMGTMGGGNLETRLSAQFGSSGPGVIEEQGGGAINPADELMELQKNSLLYTMATRRMSNIITEMKTVINVGK
ncbi:MAG: flagellar basal body protein [Candidatus Gastranaerophilaceae bacterium]